MLEYNDLLVFSMAYKSHHAASPMDSATSLSCIADFFAARPSSIIVMQTFWLSDLISTFAG